MDAGTCWEVEDIYLCMKVSVIIHDYECMDKWIGDRLTVSELRVLGTAISRSCAF